MEKLWKQFWEIPYPHLVSPIIRSYITILRINKLKLVHYINQSLFAFPQFLPNALFLPQGPMGTHVTFVFDGLDHFEVY